MFKKLLFGLVFISNFSLASEEKILLHLFETPYSLKNYDTPMFSYEVDSQDVSTVEDYSYLYARVEINFSDKNNPYPELLVYYKNYDVDCNQEDSNEIHNASIIYYGKTKTNDHFKMRLKCEERYNDDGKTKNIQYVYTGFTKKDQNIFSNALKKGIGPVELNFKNNFFLIQTNGYTKALKNKTKPGKANKIVKNIFAPEVYNGVFYYKVLSSYSIKDNNSFYIDEYSMAIELLEKNNKYIPTIKYWNHREKNIVLQCKNDELVNSRIYYSCNDNICSEEITFKKQCDPVKNDTKKYYKIALIPTNQYEDILIKHFEERTLHYMELSYREDIDKVRAYFSTRGYNEHVKYFKKEKEKEESSLDF